MAKVLIVEDSNYMRNIVRDVVTEAGHEIVAEASDGNQALKLIREFLPEVVFLDIILPGMIGLDILKITKEKYPEMKVIVVSVLEDTSIQQEALSSGAFAYICKPLTSENIKRVLYNLN